LKKKEELLWWFKTCNHYQNERWEANR